jgi:hypothetical protein
MRRIEQDSLSGMQHQTPKIGSIYRWFEVFRQNISHWRKCIANCLKAWMAISANQGEIAAASMSSEAK